jgi:hypothetical protein
MDQLKKQPGYSARLKYLLLPPLIIGLVCISSHSFAQSTAPTPPPPPPSPDEIFKKINPFKKHKKDTSNNKARDTIKNKPTASQVAPPPGGPPPPPNPLNLFKRRKDTTKKGN